MGIEPTLEAWEAAVLPLNYTRKVSRNYTAGARITICLMEIYLNGEPKSLAQAISIAQLLEDLGFLGKRIAVERNGDIVPKSSHADVMLCEGDRLEVVVAVGGG